MHTHSPMSDQYVHGYHPREHERLQDQAGTLVDLLHADTVYPPGSRVLEAVRDVKRAFPDVDLMYFPKAPPEEFPLAQF